MKKRFSEEQIVRILGEAAGHGVPTTAPTGMDVSQVAELKRLQQENTRLKKLVAERDLELEFARAVIAKK